MQTVSAFLHILSILSLAPCISLYSQNMPTEALLEKSTPEQTIALRYESEDLVNIINTLAAHKGINITLPVGATAIKANATISFQKRLTLDEAWNVLTILLQAADYRIVEKESHFSIVKINKESAKEAPLQLFFNTPADCIPDSDEHIRYLYQLKHLRASSEGESEIPKVLAAILPDNSINKLETTSNSVIMAAPARSIRAAIQIIKELDMPGFQERMDIIYLKYSSAATVASIFNENILKQSDDLSRYQIGSTASKKKGDTSYFSRNVRIVPEEQHNAIIILGREQAVDRVKTFIKNYIDVELDSGKSVIHTYKLQYLNAEDLAPVLDRIVASSRTGGTGQSQLAAGAGSGPEQGFDEVVIKADKPANPDQTKYFGSNRLIVVARKDDWIRLKELIKQLDQPLPQVLIEVLIADLSIEDTRQLGSMTRNPARIPLPSGINFQSAHVGSAITGDAIEGSKTIGIIDNPQQKVADLLRLGSTTTGSTTTPSAINLPATAGAAAISINDENGDTWSILHLLKVFKHSKILSHPHIVATHNKEAIIESGESRILRDQIVQGENNSNFRKTKDIPAKTTVKIVPRINYALDKGIEAADVNLSVEISIDEFITGTDNRNTRQVMTTTNVNNNSILALGGFIRTQSTKGRSETPILARIPLVGWFFKSRTGDLSKTSLTVFIRPTIIEPRQREALDKSTEDYIAITRMCAGEGALFDSLRDPITRWFFKEPENANAQIDRLLHNDPNKSSHSLPVYGDCVLPARDDRRSRRLKQMLEEDEECPFARG